eukprot:1815493-Pyramimonas_sp.AAC.1
MSASGMRTGVEGGGASSSEVMSMRRVVDGWVCRFGSVLLVRVGGAELGRSCCRSGGWKSMGVGCSGGIG